MGVTQSRKEKSCGLFFPLMFPLYEIKKTCQKWKRKSNRRWRKNKAMPRCSTFGSSLTLLTPTKKPIIDAKYDSWKSSFEHATHETTPILLRAHLNDTILSGQLTPKGFPKHTDKDKALKTSKKPIGNVTFVQKEVKVRRRLRLAELNGSPGVKRRRQMLRLQQQKRKMEQLALDSSDQEGEVQKEVLQPPRYVTKRSVLSNRKQLQYFLNEDLSAKYRSELICTYAQPHAIIISRCNEERSMADYDGTRIYGYCM